MTRMLPLAAASALVAPLDAHAPHPLVSDDTGTQGSLNDQTCRHSIMGGLTARW